MRNFDQFIQHLNKMKFKPHTVIDGGVAWGTPILYSVWADAFFYLIEALPYFESHMQRILRSVRGEIILTAISDFEGERSFTVGEEALSLAGFSIDSTATSRPITQQVRISTLDKEFSDRKLDGPVLLKLDLQGHDLAALRGGVSILHQCDLVIVEASFFNDKNLISEIIFFMQHYGFHLYEIFGIMPRPKDDACGQCDLAFVKRDSYLIKYKGW